MPAATVFADLSRALGARGGRGGSDGKTEKKREKTGERYEITTNILSEIPPPPPIVKTGGADEILRSPKNGVKSEAYLERYKGDTLLSRKRLRSDEYRPVQAILVKKIENTGE